MKPTMFFLPLSLFAFSSLMAAPMQNQTITRAAEQESFTGPEQYFTGKATVDRLYTANEHQPESGAYVTFEPGARSAWHTHPRGQRLIVTEGVGRTQTWGGEMQEIRPGDVVWCPPGVKHWHGAAPNSRMTHLAITLEDENGKNVDWLEKVSDAQYHGRK